MNEGLPKTRDHHVPRMYLKRFGIHRPGGPQVVAMSPDMTTRFQTSVNDVGVERGFYWGADSEGVPHHHLEDFLTTLEADADKAFRRLLDSGKNHTDDALPRWPPKHGDRLAVAWWIAAQVLRTVRQRSRLDLEQKNPIEIPEQFDSANRHIRYVAEMVQELASSVFNRPWGVGFSSYCLLTGDVPVLVLNGQDEPDQSRAVRFWDLYLPLDPHRFLYLPGLGSTGDKAIRRDHRLRIHSGHAMGLNSMIIDTAVRHVFFHPEHDPTPHLRPAVSSGQNLPQYLMHYDLISPGLGVERRWLETHPQSSQSDRPSEADPIEIMEQMTTELERRHRRFGSFHG
jgi:hypothetical protein